MSDREDLIKAARAKLKKFQSGRQSSSHGTTRETTRTTTPIPLENGIISHDSNLVPVMEQTSPIKEISLIPPSVTIVQSHVADTIVEPPATIEEPTPITLDWEMAYRQLEAELARERQDRLHLENQVTQQVHQINAAFDKLVGDKQLVEIERDDLLSRLSLLEKDEVNGLLQRKVEGLEATNREWEYKWEQVQRERDALLGQREQRAVATSPLDSSYYTNLEQKCIQLEQELYQSKSVFEQQIVSMQEDWQKSQDQWQMESQNEKQGLNEQIQYYQGHCKQLEEEIGTLREKTHLESNVKHSQLEEELQNVKEQLSNELIQHNAIKEQFYLEQNRNIVVQNEKQGLNEQIQYYQEYCKQLEEEIGTLREKTHLESNVKHSQLEEELQNVKEQLSNELTQHNAIKEQFYLEQNRYVELQQELNQIKERHQNEQNALQWTFDEKNNVIANLQNTETHLRQEIDQIKEQNESEIRALHVTIEQKTSLIETLQEQLNNFKRTDSITSVDQELVLARAQATDAQEALAVLAQESDTLRHENQSLASQLSQAQEQLRVWKERADTHSRTLREKEQEWQARIKQSNSNHVATSPVMDFWQIQQERAALENTLRDLREAFQKKESELYDSQSQQRQFESKLLEKEHLLSSVQEQVRTIQQHNVELERDLNIERHKHINEAAATSVTVLQRQVLTLQDELNSSLRAKTEAIETLQNDIAVLTVERNLAIKQKEDLARDFEILEEKYSLAQSQARSFETRLEIYGQDEKNLALQRDELLAVRQRLEKDVLRLAEEKETLTTQLKKQKDENTLKWNEMQMEHQKELNRVAHEAAELLQSMKISLAATKDERDALLQDTKRLQGQLRQWQTEKLDVQDKHDKYMELVQERDALQASVMKLQSQCAQLNHQAAITSSHLQDALHAKQTADDAREALQRQVHHLQEQMSKQQQHTSSILNNVRDEHSKLEHDLIEAKKSLRESHAHQEQALAQLRNENLALQQQNLEIQYNLQESQKAKDSLDRTLRKVQKERDDAMESVALLEKQVHQTRNELASHRISVEELNKQIKELQTVQVDQVSKNVELESLRAENASLRQRTASTLKRSTSFQVRESQLDAREHAIQLHERRLQTLERDLLQLHRDIAKKEIPTKQNHETRHAATLTSPIKSKNLHVGLQTESTEPVHSTASVDHLVDLYQHQLDLSKQLGQQTNANQRSWPDSQAYRHREDMFQQLLSLVAQITQDNRQLTQRLWQQQGANQKTTNISPVSLGQRASPPPPSLPLNAPVSEASPLRAQWSSETLALVDQLHEQGIPLPEELARSTSAPREQSLSRSRSWHERTVMLQQSLAALRAKRGTPSSYMSRTESSDRDRSPFDYFGKYNN